MDKACFGKLTAEIYNYFNSKKPPTAQQLDMWFEEINHVSEYSVPEIKRYIFKTFDACPKNLPKAIKDAYQEQPRLTKPLTYDRVEDPRYPVEQMHQAFKILSEKGLQEFRRYCENTQMPTNDQDRVLYKHRVTSQGQKMPVLDIKTVLA